MYSVVAGSPTKMTTALERKLSEWSTNSLPTMVLMHSLVCLARRVGYAISGFYYAWSERPADDGLSATDSAYIIKSNTELIWRIQPSFLLSFISCNVKHRSM